ncbi:MAG: type VI secretion system tip protein VgrG [Acidobacteriota bacterium]|nr:type VI secretion system tip protein VgrG [Acidobacteriota bacterium]
MATTQRDRLMSIATPLGENFLLINRITATEGLSSLFSFEVELLHEENEEGIKPTSVDATAILGKAVTVSISQRDGTTRALSGMVNRFTQGNRDTRFTFYYATIVPHVWILTQNRQSRIFQHKNVPDILREVFKGFEVSYELQGDFKQRNYCVQYRETDFDFASRLMEEEGIYYFFEHSGGKHKMILANTPQSHPDCPSKSDIAYFTNVGQREDFITSIVKWQTDYQLQTGKVTLWDYHFQLPTRLLDVTQPSLFNVGDNQKLEIYNYPGGYARKYDGIDRGGGANAADMNNVDTDKQKSAEILMQSLDAQYKTASGISDCNSMTAGYRFKFSNHPDDKANGQYVITSVTHEAEQNPTYVSDDEIQQPYSNSFNCIAYGNSNPPYRPTQKTPKPVIQGSQTAVVVGTDGEEIFTDKYGRVKVQFHWDRDGKNNENSSCWIRVAQTWASKKWGAMFIPRIGMEVIVHFLEGDPDQPIITGCVYNAETMPPYTLPDEKTKSTIKSNTSKDGGGFNEFRIEDKKDSEQIFIYGQKNLDVRIKNDAKEIIKHDRHLIVENDQFEKVKKDKHLKIGGDQNEEVTGTVSLKVGSNLQEKVGQNYAMDAGMAVHIKAGMSVVIEAGASLTLKVGGSFININPGGVFVKGQFIMLNSGGAAGSGGGSSPTAPTEPKEADNAEAGQAVSASSAPPPQQPKNYTALAASMYQASQDGAPFVQNETGSSGKAAKEAKAAKDAKVAKLRKDLEKIKGLNKEVQKSALSNKTAQEAAKVAKMKDSLAKMKETTLESLQTIASADKAKLEAEFAELQNNIEAIRHTIDKSLQALASADKAAHEKVQESADSIAKIGETAKKALKKL